MTTVRTATRLTSTELAAGLAFGCDEGAAIPALPAGQAPREAFSHVLLRALMRPPCVVSFSGGRDSSAILALAISVAQEHGLDQPVAATLVFPGDIEADEAEWQRPVIDHLGVETWERLVITGDDVDAVGPIARDVLSRHGLLWPFNAHLHVPILGLAGGGSLVTGFGGDELANASRSRVAARVLNSGPRHPMDLLVVGHALSPGVVRRAVLRRRYRRGTQLPWLTAEGRRQVGGLEAADEAAEPMRWGDLLQRLFLTGRYFRICQEAFATLGGDVDAEVFHPFVDPQVIVSLATTIGPAGAGDREQLMRLLFADLLPDSTLSRPGKASFTSPLWTQTAREFARRWTGRSPAPGLVDVDALRAAWLADSVDVRSTSLLQAAWLADQ
jgi:Asparagine synthase